MTYGVCNCVTGPPAGGVCQACGAVGSRYPAGATPPTPPLQPGTVIINPPSEETIRRIVREELRRALRDPRRQDAPKKRGSDASTSSPATER